MTRSEPINRYNKLRNSASRFPGKTEGRMKLDGRAFSDALIACRDGGLVVVTCATDAEIEKLTAFASPGVEVMRVGRPFTVRATARDAVMASATKCGLLLCDGTMRDEDVESLQARLEWLVHDQDTLDEITARRSKRGDAGDGEMALHFFD